MMIDVNEFLWNYILISLLKRSFKLLRKAIRMAFWSSSPPPPSPISWMGFRSPVSSLGGVPFSPANPPQETSGGETHTIENSLPELPVSVSRGLTPVQEQSPLVNSSTEKYPEENLRFNRTPEKFSELAPQNSVQNDVVLMRSERPEEISMIPKVDGLNSMVMTCKRGEVKVLGKVKKRPARIAIPQMNKDLDFTEAGLNDGDGEFKSEGRDFCLASKKGRKVMEDGYAVITDICGDSKQVKLMTNVFFLFLYFQNIYVSVTVFIFLGSF